MNLVKNIAADNLVPIEFFLSQNYPNPFSEKTIIKFCVPYRTNVKLEVQDSKGNFIKKLLDEDKKAGTYEIEFSAGEFPQGTYIYQLKAADPSSGLEYDFLSLKKMIIKRS